MHYLHESNRQPHHPSSRRASVSPTPHPPSHRRTSISPSPHTPSQASAAPRFDTSPSAAARKARYNALLTEEDSKLSNAQHKILSALHFSSGSSSNRAPCRGRIPADDQRPPGYRHSSSPHSPAAHRYMEKHWTGLPEAPTPPGAHSLRQGAHGESRASVSVRGRSSIAGSMTGGRSERRESVGFSGTVRQAEFDETAGILPDEKRPIRGLEPGKVRRMEGSRDRTK